MSTTPRHKAFISYHHAIDQKWKDTLIKDFADGADAFLDGSVSDGDLDDNLKTETIAQKIRDEYLKDSSVTIVLVGAKTWQRKHIDWEIDSSLRNTKNSKRSGLLGIVVGSYELGARPSNELRPSIPTGRFWWPHNVPARLYDQTQVGVPYALMRPWPSSAAQLKEWIHEAYLRKSKEPAPNLSRSRFANNRSEGQDHWE